MRAPLLYEEAAKNMRVLLLSPPRLAGLRSVATYAEIVSGIDLARERVAFDFATALGLATFISTAEVWALAAAETAGGHAVVQRTERVNRILRGLGVTAWQLMPNRELERRWS